MEIGLTSKPNQGLEMTVSSLIQYFLLSTRDKLYSAPSTYPGSCWHHTWACLCQIQIKFTQHTQPQSIRDFHRASRLIVAEPHAALSKQGAFSASQSMIYSPLKSSIYLCSILGFAPCNKKNTTLLELCGNNRVAWPTLWRLDKDEESQNDF